MRSIMITVAAGALATFALAAGATFAAFTDSETAAPQGLTAGTVDLELTATGASARLAVSMAPGIVQHEQDFRLVSKGSVAAFPGVRLVRLADDDLNCNKPEAASEAAGGRSATCARAGGGELSTQALISLAYGEPSGDGTCGGPATRFAVSVAPERTLLKDLPIKRVAGLGAFRFGSAELDRGAVLCVRASVSLPPEATNLVQSDRTSFDLRFELQQS